MRPHPRVPSGGWSATQPEPSALAGSIFHGCKGFHPPSAPACRLHPDRRRKVSGAVRCLPCPGASSLSLWPARPGLGRALLILAQKGISLPCPGSSGWPVRKRGHLTLRSAVWDWNPGAKTQHRAPLSPVPMNQNSPPRPEQQETSKPNAQRISWPGSGRWEENLANSHSRLLI